MADTTLLEQLTGVQIDDISQAVILGAAFAAVILTGQIGFKLSRAIRHAIARPGRRSLRPDMIATVIGAGLVLALSVEGMWEFFGSEAVRMDGAARIAFCAVFEICLIAVALRARHIRLLRQARKDELIADRQKLSDQDENTADLDEKIQAIRLRGINDLFVWALATVIGVLAAFEATGGEQFLRFIVPFVATSMWELALSADVEDQRVTTAAKHWIDRVKAGFAAFGRACTSIAVKFGWVPPTSADATEQYREKRMTQLVDVSHQIHTVDGEEAAKLRSKQRRLILGLQARGQWTMETLTELSERLDVIYRAVELTAPSAVYAVPAPRAPKPAKPPATASPKPAPKPVERSEPAPLPEPAARIEMPGKKHPSDLPPAAARGPEWERLPIEERAKIVWAECSIPPSASQFGLAIGCAKSTANEHKKRILGI